jgi:hypothetical protein
MGNDNPAKTNSISKLFNFNSIINIKRINDVMKKQPESPKYRDFGNILIREKPIVDANKIIVR